MKEKYYENLMNNLNNIKKQNSDDDTDNLLERDGFKELREFYYDEIIKMANLIAKSIYYDISIDFESTSNLSDEVRKIIIDEYNVIDEKESEIEEEEE